MEDLFKDYDDQMIEKEIEILQDLLYWKEEIHNDINKTMLLPRVKSRSKQVDIPPNLQSPESEKATKVLFFPKVERIKQLKRTWSGTKLLVEKSYRLLDVEKPSITYATQARLIYPKDISYRKSLIRDKLKCWTSDEDIWELNYLFQKKKLNQLTLKDRVKLFTLSSSLRSKYFWARYTTNV